MIFMSTSITFLGGASLTRLRTRYRAFAIASGNLVPTIYEDETGDGGASVSSHSTRLRGL